MVETQYGTEAHGAEGGKDGPGTTHVYLGWILREPSLQWPASL